MENDHISLKQQGRASLQFLGSLRAVASGELRNIAKKSFDEKVESKNLTISSNNKNVRTSREWTKLINEVDAIARMSPEYRFERFYQHHGGREVWTRGIIAVEYIFLGEPDNMHLATLRMIVLNDGKNTESDKLTLMNYAKKVYGDFDTGFNPKAYNNFEVWENGQSIVVYKRTTNEDELIEEELYISNLEYDQKLGEFYNQMEMDQLKEELK